MVDNGQIEVFNTARQEAEQIVFPIIKGHVNETRQARTGKIPDISIEKIGENQRKLNRVKALHLMISSQKDMIQVVLPYARHPAINDWDRKYKNEEKDKNPFNKEINDYSKIREIRKLLDFLESEIICADKSATKDDDFLIASQGADGMGSELTRNFYEMFRELEDSHEEIICFLIKYNLVSAGASEDESITYKELETEGIRRITEA